MIIWNKHTSPFDALAWLEAHPYIGQLYQRTSDGTIRLATEAECPGKPCGEWSEELDIADLRHWCDRQECAWEAFRLAGAQCGF